MTKTTHTLSNNQEIWIKLYTGEVLSAEKRSHTSVHQDSPIVLSEKVVVPGRIHSETHTDHEVWLKGEEGKEKMFNLGDIAIPIRPGHTISVAWGSTVGNETGYYLAARNHTTSEVRCDIQKSLGIRLREWKLNIGAGLSVCKWALGGAIVGACIGAITVSGDAKGAMVFALACVGLVVGPIVWSFIGSVFGLNSRAEALVKEINGLIRERLIAA